MLELLFASHHRSDLAHQRPCASHTKIQRYDVDHLVFLIYFHIVSYLFVVFVFCYLLVSNIFGLTDHSTSPHTSPYDAMLLQFGYGFGNIDVVDTG